MQMIWILQLTIIGIFFITIVLVMFNRKLKSLVDIKTRELEQERKLNNGIMKTMPGAFYVYEDGKRLIRWNKTFQEESGFTDEEMAGRHPLSWIDDADKERAKKALGLAFTNGTAGVEANIIFKDRIVPYYCTVTLLEMDDKKFLIGVAIDQTERRELEKQLRQAQKMESIGRLAGGIAHDFNNILMSIIGYSELTLLEMKEDDPNYENIKIIHTAGERAAALTRQLLAFSRKQVLETKVISLNVIIDNITALLGKTIGEDISIKTCLDAEGNIDADAGQIEQVLMNLVINARDAMPDGGEVIIETKNISLDENYTGLHADVQPGPYIMLAVTDTGEGMDKELIEHIFDPFFTTKALGKGTGLGLATVYGIIKQHKGYIYVYSEKGKGTTFKIYFPVSHESEENGNKVEKDSIFTKGDETVLVVDDEESVRKLIVDTLEPLGYKCLSAASGEDAVDLMKNYGENVDLLLTDVVMPGINGRELAERLKSQFPEMKVVFMSGYTENVITHRGILDDNVNYFPKPLTPLKLTKRIRAVLDD